VGTDGTRARICIPQDRHSACLRAGDQDPSRRRAAAGDLVLDGHVAMTVGNGMVIETGCQLGVQNGRRHGIAWAHFMCPSKPSDFAMSR
jgi:hypothetical protein